MWTANTGRWQRLGNEHSPREEMKPKKAAKASSLWRHEFGLVGLPMMGSHGWAVSGGRMGAIRFGFKDAF